MVIVYASADSRAFVGLMRLTSLLIQGGADLKGSSGVCVGVDHWSGLLVIGVRGV